MAKRTGKPRGGARAGAGRPKGVSNAKTEERRRETAAAIEDHFKDGHSAEYHICQILLKAASAGDVQAAIHLDNRLQGRPRESLEVTGPGGGPIEQRIFRSRLSSGAPALAPPPLPPDGGDEPAEG